MDKTLRQKKKEIPNLDKIKILYDQKFTIRSLSINFNIPYATLYRALKKPIDKVHTAWANRKKIGCYFCGIKARKLPAGIRDKRGNWEYLYHGNVIHHIDCDRKNNDEKNLVELCELCHLRLHRKIYYQLNKGGKLKIKGREKSISNKPEVTNEVAAGSKKTPMV